MVVVPQGGGNPLSKGGILVDEQISNIVQSSNIVIDLTYRVYLEYKLWGYRTSTYQYYNLSQNADKKVLGMIKVNNTNRVIKIRYYGTGTDVATFTFYTKVYTTDGKPGYVNALYT